MTDKQIAKLQRQIIKWYEKDEYGTGFFQGWAKLPDGERYVATDNYTVIILKPDQAPEIDRAEDMRLYNFFRGVRQGSYLINATSPRMLYRKDCKPIKAYKLPDARYAISASVLSAFPAGCMIYKFIRTGISGDLAVSGVYAVYYQGEIVGAVCGIHLDPATYRWADIDSAPET